MTKTIANYLVNNRWIDTVESVSFLATGEYNQNFRVDSNGESYVFRINHGSQLNIPNQIEYEYLSLKSLVSSGVTPKVYYYDSNPEEFDGGVLLMEFLPGKPLDYITDREIAAEIFAKIHSVEKREHFIVQYNPVRDIADECFRLIHKYPNHPLKNIKRTLLDYHKDIIELGEETYELFQNEEMCIVNTEVNSGNFLIDGDNGYLVDWEKPVISYCYQDLGHFLCPTTTLWKTDYRYSDEEKIDFLREYYNLMSLELNFDELIEKTKILEQTILLRGLSWCYMVYYEYTEQERTLKNTDTFKKIKFYMNEVESFLNGEKNSIQTRC